LQSARGRTRRHERDRAGTPDALSSGVMKDIVFVAVTLAFFWVSWVYAKSFDHL
jgi:hypothetical protein